MFQLFVTRCPPSIREVKNKVKEFFMNDSDAEGITDVGGQTNEMIV